MVFQNGSFYEVEIDPTGASDLITVTGSVTINGGTVTVLAASGNYQRSNEYQIITSGTGVTGTFSTVTSNLAFLDPTVVYRGNNVYLRMERNDIRFQSIGLTPNQRSIGLALDNGWAPAGVISAATGLSVAGARTAFDDLSGDIYPSLSSVMLDESQGLRNTLTNRMAGVSDSPFWLEGYGAWNRHFSNGKRLGGDHGHRWCSGRCGCRDCRGLASGCCRRLWLHPRIRNGGQRRCRHQYL